MSDNVRYQRNCYFASKSYADSFWGKYIYIYEGNGSLRLTSNSLALEGCRAAFEVPFKSITSINLSQFSSCAKPFGLSRLTVGFQHFNEHRIVHLIPYESAFDSTWATNDVVASWFKSLSEIPALQTLVEAYQDGPQIDIARQSRTPGRIFLFTICVAVPMILGLIGFLVASR